MRNLFFIIVGNFDAEDVKLGLVNHIGRFAHQIERAVCCRERDDIADVVGAGQHHDQTLKADADAAMGRCAVAEGIQEEAESLLRLFHGQADCLEDLFLQILVVDTDGAGKQLIAVENQVIGS